MVDRVMFSSNSSEWRTPNWLFEELNEEFHFELDAAATPENSLCDMYYTEKEDALSKDSPWFIFHSVYVNPPYGRGVSAWVKKAYEESQKGCTVVMLLPARTDTAWFHDYVLGKAEIRFLRGRLRFLDEKEEETNSAPFPSMIVVYRPPYKTAHIR